MHDFPSDPTRQFAKVFTIDGGQCLAFLRKLCADTPADEECYRASCQAARQNGMLPPPIDALVRLTLMTIPVDGELAEVTITGTKPMLWTAFSGITPTFAARFVRFATVNKDPTRLVSTVEDWFQRVVESNPMPKAPTVPHAGHA
jgi:hypothetical protein